MGSFTNIVDFLLVRGAPEIKYLIAYKTTTRQGVEGLMFFAFDVTKDNFADFIKGTNDEGLLAPYGVEDAKSIFASYDSANPNPELARKVTEMDGYQAAGFLNDLVKKGEFRDEDEETKAKDREEKALAQQAKIRRDLEKKRNQINEMLESGSINFNQAFHQLEKLTMERENILSEGKGS